MMCDASSGVKRPRTPPQSATKSSSATDTNKLHKSSNAEFATAKANEFKVLEVPRDLPLELTTMIDLVASQIAIGGFVVEEELRRREANNPFFSFLSAPANDPAALYYRWRLYSLLQGDSLTNWRTEPFGLQMSHHYTVVPPPLPEKVTDSLGVSSVTNSTAGGGHQSQRHVAVDATQRKVFERFGGTAVTTTAGSGDVGILGCGPSDGMPENQPTAASAAAAAAGQLSDDGWSDGVITATGGARREEEAHQPREQEHNSTFGSSIFDMSKKSSGSNTCAPRHKKQQEQQRDDGWGAQEQTTSTTTESAPQQQQQEDEPEQGPPSCIPHLKNKLNEKLLIYVHQNAHVMYHTGSLTSYFDVLPSEEERQWKGMLRPVVFGDDQKRGAANNSGSRKETPPPPGFFDEVPLVQENTTTAAVAEPPEDLETFLGEKVKSSEASLAAQTMRTRTIFFGERCQYAAHLLGLLVDTAQGLSFATLPPIHLPIGLSCQWMQVLAADALSLLFTFHEVISNHKKAKGPAVSSSTCGQSEVSAGDRKRHDVPFSTAVEQAIELTLGLFLEAIVRLVTRMGSWYQAIVATKQHSSISSRGAVKCEMHPVDVLGQTTVTLSVAESGSSNTAPTDPNTDPLAPARMLSMWLNTIFSWWRHGMGDSSHDGEDGSDGGPMLNLRLTTDLASRFGSILMKRTK